MVILTNTLKVLVNNSFRKVLTPLLWEIKNCQNFKGMFGNYFFSLFSVFKNNFIFFKLKNLFGNPKTKNVLKTQFVKETENLQKTVFSF